MRDSNKERNFISFSFLLLSFMKVYFYLFLFLLNWHIKSFWLFKIRFLLMYDRFRSLFFMYHYSNECIVRSHISLVFCVFFVVGAERHVRIRIFTCCRFSLRHQRNMKIVFFLVALCCTSFIGCAFAENEEVYCSLPRIGYQAPDFSATAVVNGEFKTVRLVAVSHSPWFICIVLVNHPIFLRYFQQYLLTT